MKIICITGMDGAGKTTLARRIVAQLREKGQPCAYVYGRTYPLVSRLLMALGRAAFLRKQDIWEDFKEYETSKKQVMRSPILTWIYTAAILFDYYLQIWLKLAIHFFSRRTIVLDRYIYDTVISDLSVHLGYSPQDTLGAIERGLKLLPRPALTILIDLPEEVAFERKDDVPHLDYLRQRRKTYLLLENSPGVTRLDGSQAADSLLEQSMAARRSTALPE